MSFNEQEYFCVAPWVSVYINPDGRVAPCCISHADLGNINDQDIASIINGPKVVHMRERMLENEPDPSCKDCWKHDYQRRLQKVLNDRYINHLKMPVEIEEFFSSPNNFHPKYLDLRWNNTCNFACVYCGPDLSSLWAEVARDDKGNIIPIKKNRRENKDQLLVWTEENLPYVDDLYLAGGEPFMIKENLTLLQQIKKIKPEMNVLVNTNLSHSNDNAIFEILKTLPNVRWLVSGESVGEIFEYIRWPGKWDVFEANLHILKALRSRGHTIYFNLVGMNINCFSIWDYIDFVLAHEFCDTPEKIDIPLQNHQDPHHAFALSRLPMAFKDQVNERVAKSRYGIPAIQNYLDHLNAQQPETLAGWSGLELTIKELEKFDRARKIQSRKVFHDIYRYVDNHPR